MKSKIFGNLEKQDDAQPTHLMCGNVLMPDSHKQLQQKSELPIRQAEFRTAAGANVKDIVPYDARNFKNKNDLQSKISCI